MSDKQCGNVNSGVIAQVCDSVYPDNTRLTSTDWNGTYLRQITKPPHWDEKQSYLQVVGSPAVTLWR